MTTISRLTLSDAVVARLGTLPGVTVYKGEVPDAPPVIEAGGFPDAAGRVAPYVVIYGSAGTPNTSQADLGDAADDLDWGVQVTVAAGYEDDCLHTVDRVHTALYRWAPTGLGAGIVAGGLRPPVGFDPGPARIDNDVQPPRFWLPLLYRTTVTT